MAPLNLTSIIILTCNQLQYTKLCLESIRRSAMAPYELIVVDNASIDGTVAYLQSQKDISLILNPENKGFARGCNQGIKAASGDYVLLLNNDTIVSYGWLSNMVRCMESDPRIGIVGPKSNFAKGSQVQFTSYRDFNQMLQFSQDYNKISDPAKWFQIEMVTGFCMLIRSEVFDLVGLLDEQFGIGSYEDDDFCLRTRLKGYKIMCAGDTFVHHFGNITFVGNRVNTDKIDKENIKKYHNKWS